MLIDVIGSKGGVGTTTAAVNLASSLVDLGKQVALVDMNLMFGEDSCPPEYERCFSLG